MANIFISYRRAGLTEFAAGVIYSSLVDRFGQENVFIDRTYARAGDFREMIERELRQAKIVLVLIDQDWLGIARAKDKSRRSDYVFWEIERALALKIEVLPVLLFGSQMPSSDQLRVFNQDITQLAYKRAIEFRDGVHYPVDIEQLILLLQEQIPDLGSNRPVKKVAGAELEQFERGLKERLQSLAKSTDERRVWLESLGCVRVAISKLEAEFAAVFQRGCCKASTSLTIDQRNKQRIASWTRLDNDFLDVIRQHHEGWPRPAILLSHGRGYFVRFSGRGLQMDR